MQNLPLDIYDFQESQDDKTEEQIAYLRKYGWHFNRKAVEFAVSKMRKADKDNPGKTKKVELVPIEQVDEILKAAGVHLSNDVGHDHVYVYHKVLADNFGGSIEDQKHAAMYVKETIDDPDAADGTVMRMWMAKMVGEGIWVPWRKFM